MKEIFDFSGISLEKILANENTIGNTKNNCECINEMPIAMAYVPIQSYKKTYEPDSALCFGTIFPELNKPFLGCKANRGDYK